MKHLIKDVLEGHEILELAKLDATGPGRAFLKILEADREAQRRINDHSPQISNEIKKDFRFVAGGIAKLNEALGLQADAAKILKKAGEKE